MNPRTVLKGNLGADGRFVLTGLLIVKYRPAELLAVTQRSVNAEHHTNLTAGPLFTASFTLEYSSVKGKTNFLLPRTLNRH